MDLSELKWEGVAWIHVTQNRDQWCALWKTCRFHKRRGISSLAELLLASQERLFSMELDGWLLFKPNHHVTALTVQACVSVISFQFKK